MFKQPCIWTIAGSDPSAGAGIQTDLLTCAQLNVYAATVITTLTAQNSLTVSDVHVVPAALITAQLNRLAEDCQPVAIKLGLLGDAHSIQAISQHLTQHPCPIICDPVCAASDGSALLDEQAIAALRQQLLPQVHLLTPNLPEAAVLLQQPLAALRQDIPNTARALHALGAQAVLLKGGHAHGELSHDYFFDGQHGYYLSLPRLANIRVRGTGCSLASALACAIAQGESLLDACVLGKAYVHQAMHYATQQGQGALHLQHHPWPCLPEHVPWLTTEGRGRDEAFADCGAEPLGLYGIVDNLNDLQHALANGVDSMQLRIKQIDSTLSNTLQQAIALAKQHDVRLFINDHWQLALQHGAYGVHLGQDDLREADIEALRNAGLRLGISCHNLHELAIAHAYRPSYIGFGPIFPTQSKSLSHATQGLTRLQQWCRCSPYPIVAIGGLDVNNINAVRACGTDGTAVLSALPALIQHEPPVS